MLGLKLVLLFAVLAAGMLGGAIPLRRRPGQPSGRLLDRGNAFAAGIFLGAGFLHALPDAHAAWSGIVPTYPVAFLLAASAILALLLIEHVLPPEAAHHALHAPSADRFAPHAGHAPGPSTAYAILTALSIHSFLAGLGLGVQRELPGILVLFVAIIAHKSVAGFALGVSLSRHGMSRRRAWSLLWLFALATPAGILVGAAFDVSLEGALRQGFEAGFLALAAGTFAYVATVDILREEFGSANGRFGKWLWVVAGTACMALLAGWV